MVVAEVVDQADLVTQDLEGGIIADPGVQKTPSTGISKLD